MFKKILFGTDFSENSHWAFTYALNLAKIYKAELFVLHVTPVPKHPEQISNYLSPEKLEELMKVHRDEIEKEFTYYLQNMKGFKNHKILLNEGEPFVEIIQTAKRESVDLIVMGTHGRTSLDHVLFGSTAEKVVRKSPCPVLTIPLPGKRFRMP